VEAVLLTNADLDHVLGLFLLREGGDLTIHTTSAVRETLVQGLRLEAVLAAFGEVAWKQVPEDFTPLLDRHGQASGLSYRAILLPGGPPPYAREVVCAEHGHSIAYEFIDDTTVGRLLVAPDLAEVTPSFRAALIQADAVIIDATFWSDGELAEIRPGARTARQMGHLPISGPGGTLELMQTSSARYKVCMHTNNTNPVFLPGSPERGELDRAGMIVPEDGFEFTL
jgi:pyrroloquinoline quinone biosynthesis protein B